MLSKVNNVFKDNPIFASSLFYFVPTPPTFNNFQNPWPPPFPRLINLTTPVYYEPEGISLAHNS